MLSAEAYVVPSDESDVYQMNHMGIQNFDQNDCIWLGMPINEYYMVKNDHLRPKIGNNKLELWLQYGYIF